MPAVATFDKWAKKVDPQTQLDLYTLYGWINAQLFVQALQGAGANPTRASLDAQLNKITSFNASGLISNSEPGPEDPRACWIVAQYENGTWKRIAPDPKSGFICNPRRLLPDQLQGHLPLSGIDRRAEGERIVNEFVSFVVAGIVTGSIYAVTASGLVVTYNATGVFNFAHGAVGMFLAYLYWQFWQGWGWNPVLSLVLVLLVVAPLFALVDRTGAHAPALRLVAQHHDRGDARTVPRALRHDRHRLEPDDHTKPPGWFAGDQVDVFGVNLTYEELITVGCAVAVALGAVGTVQANPDGRLHAGSGRRPALASLTGARTSRISGFAWMIGFGLAGLAGILLAPGTGHEHPDPLRTGHLRLCRRHRRASAQPAAHLPRRHDPRRRRIAGRRLRPGRATSTT